MNILPPLPFLCHHCKLVRQSECWLAALFAQYRLGLSKVRPNDDLVAISRDLANVRDQGGISGWHHSSTHGNGKLPAIVQRAEMPR